MEDFKLKELVNCLFVLIDGSAFVKLAQNGDLAFRIHPTFNQIPEYKQTELNNIVLYPQMNESFCYPQEDF